MNRESTMHLRPDAIEVDEREPGHAVEEFAFVAHGVTFLPAGVAFAKTTGENGTTFGTIMLKTGNVGLHRPMTAATLRRFAQSMLTIADELEHHAADQATAAIERARNLGAGK